MESIGLRWDTLYRDLVNNGKAPRSLELFKRRKQGFLSPLVVHSAHRLKQIFKRLVDVSAAEFAIVDRVSLGGQCDGKPATF